MTYTADYWIDSLGLAEHPEGGYFRQTYCSSDAIAADGLPGRFGGPRPVSTAIYYLLRGNQHSALHRLRADEVWHHYAGSSLTLHLIHPDGRLTHSALGTTGGEAPQVVVPAGCWFGATVDDTDSYALVGCTVAPGFRMEDFELGQLASLLEQYPQHEPLIRRLTSPGGSI